MMRQPYYFSKDCAYHLNHFSVVEDGKTLNQITGATTIVVRKSYVFNRSASYSKKSPCYSQLLQDKINNLFTER